LVSAGITHDVTGFTDTAGGFPAIDKMNFDPRHFIDAEHAIVSEVGLLDAAVLDCDLAVQRA